METQTYNIDSVLESLDEEEETVVAIKAAVVEEEDDRYVQQELVDEPLKAYLREIGASALLTFEEEKSLARAIEFGAEAKAKLEGGGSDVEGRLSLEQAVQVGASSRRRMTESNLRLVVSIAKKYQGKGLPLLDLIQEGNLGLIRAVDKYDYRRGIPVQHLCNLVDPPRRDESSDRQGSHDPVASALERNSIKG